MNFDQLKAPFPPDRISWRVGSTTGDKSKGMALAYIDARDVMERLDEIAGPAGWQCDYPHANGKTVCRIGIKVGDEWIWKADGAGDTDYEAEKGALSDAFKRAAVRWGIGRYLYDISSPWVAVEQRGKTYVIKESELPRLQKLLASQAPSEWRAPAGQAADPLRTYADQVLQTLATTPSDKLMSLWTGVKGELKRLGVKQLDDPIYVELKDAFAKRHEATAQMEAA
jgi:hypothetical protein